MIVKVAQPGEWVLLSGPSGETAVCGEQRCQKRVYDEYFDVTAKMYISYVNGVGTWYN